MNRRDLLASLLLSPLTRLLGVRARAGDDLPRAHARAVRHFDCAQIRVPVAGPVSG